MKIFALAAIIYFSLIFLRKRLFLFPYLYLFGTITESHGLSRIFSNYLGDYLSLSKLITGLLCFAFVTAKKPKFYFRNNNLILIIIMLILYFNSSFFWADLILDKGVILTLPLIGVITYVFAWICIDEKNELHFIRAISLSSIIISFASLTIFFNLEFFNFLGGNYLNINSFISDQGVFRSKPLNLNSNIASLWISIGSVFIFSFHINKIKMWDVLPISSLAFLLIFNIGGLLAISSLSAFISLAIMLIVVLLLSNIKQKNKTFSKILFVLFVFIVFSVFTGLGDNIINRLKENQFDSDRAEYYEDVSGFGGRGEIFEKSFVYFLESPLIGNGVNSFLDAHGKSLHNSFLWALTSGGLIGFVLWFVLNLSLLTSLRSLIFSSDSRQSISASLSSICFGIIIYSLAHNIHFNKFFWVIVALVIANVSRK